MTDALHEAAVWHLTALLAQTRMATQFEVDPSADDRDYRALITLLSIGAIGSGEAAEWQARFDRAREPHAEPDDDLRRRATAHLEELDAAGGDVVTAVNALAGARAITPADAGRWIAPRRVPIGADPDDPDPPPAFDDSEFVDAVLGPETREGGVRVTVVELYRGGTVVNWHFAGEAGFDLDDPLALEDDLGTRYREAGGGGTSSETGGYAWGHWCFATAVPARASHLDVVAGAGRIRIPL